MSSMYQAASGRYGRMRYRRSGISGLRLPAISLGLWHNFGGANAYGTARGLIRHAFDAGITHFDLANNYGPPPGSAEQTFGQILAADLRPYRDEIVVSSKAGYTMWDGPYGDWGSRKYLISSLDQSLSRMKLDYVDIFYHHRFDPETPLEETMGALDHLVRQGKALYVGLSNYDADSTRQASALLKRFGTPCLIHQPRYSMLDRGPEAELLGVLEEEGIGCIAYSPLAKGILTDRYLQGIPADSRAAGSSVFLQPEDLTKRVLDQARALENTASRRGQKLSQLALAWALRFDTVTSALIGASRTGQIDDAVAALDNLPLSDEELAEIERILQPEPAGEEPPA
ncbi:aldo/keto reductase [Cohnella cellulosilytica]|uniref:Aldo/keto reductase n=1 Tax=Cohnella cellulosilytica TaxID=986710 RepID=A0ABW2FC57_9BACL